MGLADALQAGDIVTISAPEGNYYIVSKQSNGTCILTTSLDDDSVEQSVSLEVLRVGRYALFRSALADNKVLQATKDSKAPLTFANYNTGSWEQWDVLGESLISCVLVNRQYPTRKLTVKIDVVHHVESSTSGSLPPVVEAKSVAAATSAEDASRGAELTRKPSGGVASIPIVGLVASAVGAAGAGAGAVLGAVTGRLSRQNSRAQVSQGDSLTTSPEKSARFNRSSGASDDTTRSTTAAVSTPEQAVDAAELNRKLEHTKKQLFSESNPFAASLDDSTIPDADATNRNTRAEELNSTTGPTEEQVVQSEPHIVEEQQPLAEPAQVTPPLEASSEPESGKSKPTIVAPVPAIEETVKQLPTEVFEPTPMPSEAVVSRVVDDSEQPMLAESVVAGTQLGPTPPISGPGTLANDINDAVDAQGEQLAQVAPVKPSDLAEEAAFGTGGAGQAAQADAMTDARAVSAPPEKVDAVSGMEGAPTLPDAPVDAAEPTAAAELPVGQRDKVPSTLTPGAQPAKVQPEALPTLTSVPQLKVQEVSQGSESAGTDSTKLVRDPLDERVKLVVIDDPSPVGASIQSEQQALQSRTVKEEAPRTFLGTPIGPVSTTPAVETTPSETRVQASESATPATGGPTTVPSFVAALQQRGDTHTTPVETRLPTPPKEGVRARRASEQVVSFSTPPTDGERARRASEHFVPQDFPKAKFGLQPAEAPTAVADQKAPASARVTVVGDTPTTEGQWTKATEPKRKSKRFMCGCFG